jgi:diamine N-acetyltransferase
MEVNETEAIFIRRTLMEDIPFVLEAEQDKENREFISQWTKSGHEEALSNPDMAHFIVEDKQQQKMGYIILLGLTNPNDSINLKRIVIVEKEKGYGRKALALIIQWAFDNDQVHRLWLHVKEVNSRARHLYSSVGFVTEGILRDSLRVGDKYESMAVMSILRSEYN